MLSPAIIVCGKDKKVQEKIKFDKKSKSVKAPAKQSQIKFIFLIKLCFLGYFIDKSEVLRYNLSIIKQIGWCNNEKKDLFF